MSLSLRYIPAGMIWKRKDILLLFPQSSTISDVTLLSGHNMVSALFTSISDGVILSEPSVCTHLYLYLLNVYALYYELPQAGGTLWASTPIAT